MLPSDISNIMSTATEDTLSLRVGYILRTKNYTELILFHYYERLTNLANVLRQTNKWHSNWFDKFGLKLTSE